MIRVVEPSDSRSPGEPDGADTACLQDVLHVLKEAERKRLSRDVAMRLEPLTDFLDRYLTTVDVIVQGTINPVALVWGVLRGLIEVGCTLFTLIHHLKALALTTSQGSERIYEILSEAHSDARIAWRHSEPLLGVCENDSGRYPFSNRTTPCLRRRPHDPNQSSGSFSKRR
jgi:hypothetical protein